VKRTKAFCDTRGVFGTPFFILKTSIIEMVNEKGLFETAAFLDIGAFL
jgi:hypothetical protein